MKRVHNLQRTQGLVEIYLPAADISKREAVGTRLGASRKRPAAVCCDHRVDALHQARRLGEGGADPLVPGDVVERERAPLAILQPLLGGLIAAPAQREVALSVPR